MNKSSDEKLNLIDLKKSGVLWMRKGWVNGMFKLNDDREKGHNEKNR